jgi:hypothetical protein
MGGEALGSSAASNGGSDASGREVLVGEIVTSDPPGRASNGGNDSPGESRDTPPLQ